MPCPSDCQVPYRPHRHFDAMERLDFDDKRCGCGQTGCMDQGAAK